MAHFIDVLTTWLFTYVVVPKSGTLKRRCEPCVSIVLVTPVALIVIRRSSGAPTRFASVTFISPV